MSEKLLRKLTQAVIDGEPEDATELAKQALDQGMDPLTCINEGLTLGMNHIGDLFAAGEVFVPDLVLGGKAMKEALAIFEPALVKSQKREVVGRVVLGTVKGDMHEIGKTLVGVMLTANGFQVTDIGINQSADNFISAIKETNATLIGASALLTTTMRMQQKLIVALKEAGIRDQVKVMIGGAPVSKDWAERVGADGYAEDAIEAIAVAKRLVGAPV